MGQTSVQTQRLFTVSNTLFSACSSEEVLNDFLDHRSPLGKQEEKQGKETNIDTETQTETETQNTDQTDPSAAQETEQEETQEQEQQETTEEKETEKDTEKVVEKEKETLGELYSDFGEPTQLLLYFPLPRQGPPCPNSAAFYNHSTHVYPPMFQMYCM